MELFGALCLTVIAAIAIFWCIGMPWLALGFGGPSVGNWAWMIGGLIVASGIAYGWWVLVGSSIHFSFG